MTAIFCRTGSAIQSAVAKWNLTSAFEFTVDERRREHRSLRLLRRLTPRGPAIVLKPWEATHPTNHTHCSLCQLAREGAAKTVIVFWGKNRLLVTKWSSTSHVVLQDSEKNRGMGSMRMKATCS
jgi:hypothetical protein